ncbi:hypothetical protein [Niabella ginsengisoli]|uniref:Uncharacterized protein n=1 Tax=Niabella ginsengisoli TaxID=522298 RepID=A0ABS9SFS5_9BACT|nr:hypothetical protein [Niabella ginsengisoli]MCH5597034.1 hypothetical protein [Niabella ginsengisoli]
MIKAIFFNLIFILSFSAVAFAEGEANDNDLGKEKPKNGLSLDKSKQLHSFSLRSGMYFKGGNLINAESASNNNYTSFNINFQKEQNNFIQHNKKKALLSKLTFNPNELLRNYSGK